MTGGISGVFGEEGQRWLRVSPGHAISEDWLHDNVPDLYAEWSATTSVETRDQIALQIELRLEHVEPDIGSQRAGDSERHEARPTPLADRIARYENNAERLGMLTLSDPLRPAPHLAQQIEGDALREALRVTHSGRARYLLERRLDAADLVADRPLIEAVSGMDAQVDRLVAVLAGAGNLLGAQKDARALERDRPVAESHDEEIEMDP